MSNIPESNFNFFHLTENGFLIINVLIGITIILGIITAILFFRNNLSGTKIMLLGGEIIFLGLIFNIIVDYKVRISKFEFYKNITWTSHKFYWTF